MKNEELVKQLTSPSKNSRLEKFGKTITFLCLALIVFIVAMILLFVAQKGLATFFVNKVSLVEFLFSGDWSPSEGKFGALPMILGSFVVTLLSFVRFIFGGTGFGILSGTFVLFVMILPTVTFMTTDTLRAVPRHYREASLAMGATRWQTIWRVTLNAAKSGIFTAVIFGMARAFGEALAIQMVVGNSAVIPTSLTTPAATLTSVLTMGIGNTVMGTVSNNVLWSLALVLLLMSLGFNMLVKFITRERKRNYER